MQEPKRFGISSGSCARDHGRMPSAHAPISVGVAVLTLRVKPGEPLCRLIPAGQFDAPRGAMAGAGPWNLTPDAAARIIAANATRSADIPIDYEHQLLSSADNGKPAPASGWISPRSLVYIPDGPEPGLYGAVKWTARAAVLIAADEYRYLSPVFPYDPQSGEPLDLLHLALTNFPAIDEPIRAALSARHAHTHNQENPVNEVLKKLLAALGLPDTTAEADALAGVAALKAKADAATIEIASLKAAAEAKNAEVTALKAGGAAPPDPAKYVPIGIVQSLQTEVAVLSARINGDEAGRVVEQAIAEGKLLEAQRTWATELGLGNLAALKSYVAATPAIAALSGMQSGGKPPVAGGNASLSESELAVCRAMGLSEADYIKSKEAK